MNITFLGTGTSQGIPVIGCDCPVCSSLDFRDKRSRTALHIDIQGKSIVIDTGPDFRQQMLQSGIRRLDAVLYTHEHKDHTAGLDDIRPFNFSQKMDIPIYGTNRVLTQIRKEYSYIFETVKYPGIPGIIVNEIFNKPFLLEGIKVLPIEVLHYKLPVLGYRFGDFTYITDASFIHSKELEKAKGSKILVLNALQIENHISHFSLEKALQIVDKIQPEKAFFTHIGHRLGNHKEAEIKLPDHVKLAYDGLKISLD